MRVLKTIALLSLFLSFYPLFAIPAEFKEWLFAVLAFAVLVLSLYLIYKKHEEESDPAFVEFEKTSIESKDSLNKQNNDSKI